MTRITKFVAVLAVVSASAGFGAAAQTKAQEAGASSAASGIEAARQRQRAGDLEGALAEVDKSLAASPDRPDLHLLRLTLLLPKEVGLRLTTALDKYHGCTSRSPGFTGGDGLRSAVDAACAGEKLDADSPVLDQLLEQVRACRASEHPEHLLVPVLALSRHIPDDPRVLFGLGEGLGVESAPTFDSDAAAAALARLQGLLAGDDAEAAGAALIAFLGAKGKDGARGVRRAITLYRGNLGQGRPIVLAKGFDVDVDRVLARAKAARRSGDQAECLQCAKELRETNPNDPAPDLLEGEVYGSIGKETWSLMRDRFKTFLQKTKGGADEDWALGETLAALGFEADERNLGDLTPKVRKWMSDGEKSLELRLRVPDRGELSRRLNAVEKRLAAAAKRLDAARADRKRLEEKKKKKMEDVETLSKQQNSGGRVDFRDALQRARDAVESAVRDIDSASMRIERHEKEVRALTEEAEAYRARF